MVLKWILNLISDTNEKKIEKLKPLVEIINSLEPEIKSLSDDALRAKTAEFRSRIEKGESLDDILPEAFAAVREASVRTTGMRHFDVQLMGGIVLHQGKIAEMATGEGKTLVATLPVYLNALSGRGVHLVTVNDYLARRDSEWMGPIYKMLGLSVGLIQHDMDYPQRKEAYGCDLTYGTNNEFGFDYLRDNMAHTLPQCVQRSLNYAIVDEVDSILIDEARTPLIISGMVEQSLDGYLRANQIAQKLNKEGDFTLDEKTKNAALSEEGIKKVEALLKIESLFDVKNMDLAHQILQSLKAWHLFKRDIDYVIKDGEIIIVDEFTGRLMFGRRYSDGLHQAIEAKENVAIKEESQTLATITFQNYFRMFKKLAGMTGTALTEEAEFGKIYNLEVIVIPTNRPLIRGQFSDVIYKTKKEKFSAAADEIEARYKEKKPVLVGTISIENSELLSQILKRRGVLHQVLNAKNHEREAEIVAQAGQPGSITISTNMAGRGTDIVLGEGVSGGGGLHVIGTERHESRRIDNQLRGRAGRQGDPGSSRFYLSLEDDLMRLFGSQRIASVMERLGIEEGTPIEHPFISRAIENAQKKVEEYHFNVRKQILEFDDVMNKQRETIYSLRRQILEGENVKRKIEEMFLNYAQDLLDEFIPEKVHPEQWDIDGLKEALLQLTPYVLDSKFDSESSREAILQEVKSFMEKAYGLRESDLGAENMRQLEKFVLLKEIDSKWIDHLHNMDLLRDGIGLRAYGQKDPLIEYKIEGYQMFSEMMKSVYEDSLKFLFRVQVVREEVAAPQIKRVTYGAPQERPAQNPYGLGPSQIFAGPSQPEPILQPVTAGPKIGRNDPCPCGSGKKYKKCCGK